MHCKILCLGGFYFSSLSTVNMPRLGNKKVNFFSSFSINMMAGVEGPQTPDRLAYHLLWDIEFFLQGSSLMGISLGHRPAPHPTRT